MSDTIDYKGDIAGFPREVVERMLECQEEQGNEKDATVFERYSLSVKNGGGFDWHEAKELGGFWPVNKIIYTVEYDYEIAHQAEQIARQLAIKVISGSFMESGQAARELDAFVRHQTGVAKAKYVAAFVRILLETGEPVLLAGWHRDVYTIWAKELADHNPMFYTGEESPTQKEQSKQAFVSGASNLLIMSLRSGIGVDGLQHRCTNVVFGELDWSPKVHDQFTARVDRDGQQGQVTAYYLVSEDGSDPVIMDILGLKASQAQSIVDPFTAAAAQHNDESRIKVLAERFINKKSK